MSRGKNYINEYGYFPLFSLMWLHWF